VSSLLVNRRTHEDAWAIVTRKDVVRKVVDPGKNRQGVKVFEIMTKPLFYGHPQPCAEVLRAASPPCGC
jgi:signal-transduction protein with cAMP-binding, CBS, and nucleotidyltransferase domain